MSTLLDLNLNRYLYKGSQPPNPDTSLQAQNNNTTNYGAGDPATPGAANQLANGVAPGTVITSVILQSSPSQDRIEIDPDDVMRVYNNNVVILTIDKNGINGSGAAFISETVGTLNVTTKFNYFGIPQPVLYTGFVNGGTGAITSGPVGWTGVRNSIGNYTITHTIAGSPVLKLHVNPDTGTVIMNAFNSSTTAFSVIALDDAGSFVDVNFNFLALLDLP
ncbi:MAG: hypothetical protein V4509_00690 [Patescibacteria group bacterium]